MRTHAQRHSLELQRTAMPRNSRAAAHGPPPPSPSLHHLWHTCAAILAAVAAFAVACVAHGQPTPPVPTPNPPTCMTIVTVPGAVEAGAVYPNNQPAHYELNFTNSSSFVLHLSGGGWRFMGPSEASADALASPPPLTPDGLGVDTLMARRAAPNGACGGCYGVCDGIMSVDPTRNPLFHDWNKIFVPISGTSFTGDRSSDAPYPVRGARILASVVGHLQSAYGMAKADNVIVTGGSSGGLATYLVCDRVAGLIRAVSPSTRVVCLADAGFFLDHNDTNGNPSTTPEFKESYYAWNSSAGTNQDCVAHYKPTGEEWRCIFAQYVVPFIKTPLFVAQNLYDSWQLNNILKVVSKGCGGYGKPMTGCSAAQMSAVEAYGATMRGLLTDAVGPSFPGRGIFAPSCIAHCQTVENEHPAALWDWPARWSINASTPQLVFDSWFAGSARAGPKQALQTCAWSPQTCNSKCPDFT